MQSTRCVLGLCLGRSDRIPQEDENFGRFKSEQGHSITHKLPDRASRSYVQEVRTKWYMNHASNHCTISSRRYSSCAALLLSCALPILHAPFTPWEYSLNYAKAIFFLISAIAKAGFSPFGQVLEQFKIVWHRYKLMPLLSASRRSAFFSSRESAIQR